MAEAGHQCCFKASVIDSYKPTGYLEEHELICECFDLEGAEKIAAALNALEAE